jgi:hypothetical protein
LDKYLFSFYVTTLPSKSLRPVSPPLIREGEFFKERLTPLLYTLIKYSLTKGKTGSLEGLALHASY